MGTRSSRHSPKPFFRKKKWSPFRIRQSEDRCKERRIVKDVAKKCADAIAGGRFDGGYEKPCFGEMKPFLAAYFDELMLEPGLIDDFKLFTRKVAVQLRKRDPETNKKPRPFLRTFASSLERWAQALR